MARDFGPTYTAESWWDRKVRREADRDIMKMGERIGNVVAIFLIVLVTIVILDIQTRGYFGLFTSGFGPVEQLLFYASLLFGIVPCLVRAATGRRNLGRLADLFGAALFIIVAAYLLMKFPFDFNHLIDILPSSARSDFTWVNNDLFRLLIGLAIFITILSTAYNMILYLSVRRELKERNVSPAPNTEKH